MFWSCQKTFWDGTLVSIAVFEVPLSENSQYTFFKQKLQHTLHYQTNSYNMASVFMLIFSLCGKQKPEWKQLIFIFENIAKMLHMAKMEKLVTKNNEKVPDNENMWIHEACDLSNKNLWTNLCAVISRV